LQPAISVLDLAFVAPGQTARDALAATVTVAARAEALGYKRVWYAEHHNMPAIASSAPAVLVAHVAAHTRSIRLGAGGVMLPNHAPLAIAEQFGTLATLHPGRIDLALGRAPGTDPRTTRALRVPPDAFDSFPGDVLELEGYFAEASLVPGVDATPGQGTRVPLFILGSSLFGARLAAELGLPYGFASHFAPDLLEEAVAVYRREFRPARDLAAPYVIAGLNVVAADAREDAEAAFASVLRFRVRALLGRGAALSDAEADALLATPAGARVKAMGTYTAIGTGPEVGAYARRFAERAHADELMTVHAAATVDARLRSMELLAAELGAR
jgi:luciferase family oxidoreductase group 1